MERKYRVCYLLREGRFLLSSLTDPYYDMHIVDCLTFLNTRVSAKQSSVHIDDEEMENMCVINTGRNRKTCTTSNKLTQCNRKRWCGKRGMSIS